MGTMGTLGTKDDYGPLMSMSVIVRYCPLLSVIVRNCPLLSVLVRYRPFV